jgi:hypothetical protein
MNFDELLGNAAKKARGEKSKDGKAARLLCLDGGGIKGLVMDTLGYYMISIF